MPVHRLNALVKWLWSENPTSPATSASGRDEHSSNCLALLILHCRRYSEGDKKKCVRDESDAPQPPAQSSALRFRLYNSPRSVPSREAARKGGGDLRSRTRV